MLPRELTVTGPNLWDIDAPLFDTFNVVFLPIFFRFLKLMPMYCSAPYVDINVTR